jgi:hypothetical protein
MPDRAYRHVSRRDGRLEGQPDVETDARRAPGPDRAMKDAQRDLTSLSGPVPRGAQRPKQKGQEGRA